MALSTHAFSCQDGEVHELRLLPGEERVYGLLLRLLVSVANRGLLTQTYGPGDRFGATKRQLDSQTLARHGLR
jgi:hypothetical protein